MARRRASMREGPLAELFRATEAAQKQAERAGAEPAEEPAFEATPRIDEPMPPVPDPTPDPMPEPGPPAPEPPPPVEPPPAARFYEPAILPEPAPRLHRATRADTPSYLAVIRVVGVGGAGLNAVDRMLDAGINQVEFVAVNTDIQQLHMTDAPVKIHIGRELTQGLG